LEDVAVITTIEALREHTPKKAFLICIDSDGCAFDTMELKHKECFIPNIIRYWGLQPVSRYARQAAEFVNLYSKWRGINRFPALIKTFDLLEEWDVVRMRHAKVPQAPHLREWVQKETRLSNAVLETYLRENDFPDLRRALEWSRAVNKSVEDIVQGGVPPFPFVRESLEAAVSRADIMVCSQTPTEALVREWTEQGLAQYLFAIAGQELGSKAEHIALASEGRYDNHHILMIGDAPGDLSAARKNKACFFPIVPGQEEQSWRRLFEEGLERFFSGTYHGPYQDALIHAFETSLPELPPWKTSIQS
jgi:phosphoglycolate phosphatase-like HAD superfamily hydrolase